MSMIRARNTQPEIRLRKMLSVNGLRGYRLHYKLMGKPDIVFPLGKIAIFIDGCFWHKCPGCFIKPATNKKFWQEKIESNVKRDRIVNRELRKKGWKVLRIWDSDIKDKIHVTIKKIKKMHLYVILEVLCPSKKFQI